MGEEMWRQGRMGWLVWLQSHEQGSLEWAGVGATWL